MTSPEHGRVVGLFAGIGGIEIGLARAGVSSVLLCEIDPRARAVLQARFPDVPLHDDVTTLDELPVCDVVTAGFPCQDLSQAGRTAGIGGRQSSLVEHVFRLLDGAPTSPRWVVLENVPFMLRLDRGRAMHYLLGEFERRGFAWAYRVVDSRAFGLPQRRQRVVLVASRTDDPTGRLLAPDRGEPETPDREGRACGFYWTEGTRGLGWAVDAVPTLKGGSGLGIPSPPAIWMPDGRIVLPAIQDAERLQGFPADWTAPAAGGRRGDGPRWKLVGNAVSVPMAEWLGGRLAEQCDDTLPAALERMREERPWPKAAARRRDERVSVSVSAWPERVPHPGLEEFLGYPTRPLSRRAAAGFLGRARRGSLNIPSGLLDALDEHLDGLAAAA